MKGIRPSFEKLCKIFKDYASVLWKLIVAIYLGLVASQNHHVRLIKSLNTRLQLIKNFFILSFRIFIYYNYFFLYTNKS